MSCVFVPKLEAVMRLVNVSLLITLYHVNIAAALCDVPRPPVETVFMCHTWIMS